MQVGNWLKEFVLRPRWAMHRLKNAVRARLVLSSRLALVEDYTKYLQELPEALRQIARIEPHRITDLLNLYEAPEIQDDDGGIPTSWSASPNLLRVYFVLCRILRPQLVIETGVAAGVSTALLLRELSRIEDAKLISFELPRLGQTNLSYIGSRVPQALRKNWKLVVAPAALQLRKMTELHGKVDLFIHDSDFSYVNQVNEYRIAMKILVVGGVLVSNGVKNRAFWETCAAFGTTPIIVRAKEKGGYIGLTRKFSDLGL